MTTCHRDSHTKKNYSFFQTVLAYHHHLHAFLPILHTYEQELTSLEDLSAASLLGITQSITTYMLFCRYYIGTRADQLGRPVSCILIRYNPELNGQTLWKWLQLLAARSAIALPGSHVILNQETVFNFMGTYQYACTLLYIFCTNVTIYFLIIIILQHHFMSTDC